LRRGKRLNRHSSFFKERAEGGDARHARLRAKEEENSERTRRLRDCFGVSAAVEELFTPDCSACASRLVQRQSWPAAVSVPAACRSDGLELLAQSHSASRFGLDPRRPPMKQNERSARQVWKCWIEKTMNRMFSEACAKKVLDRTNLRRRSVSTFQEQSRSARGALGIPRFNRRANSSGDAPILRWFLGTGGRGSCVLGCGGNSF
jgi:hypothetical protein